MAIRDPATGKRWVYFPNTSGSASQAEWTGSAWSVTLVGSAAVKSGTNVSVVADFATGNKWLYYTRISSGWIGEIPYSGGHWLSSTLIEGPTQGKASPSALRDPANGNRFVYFVDSSGELHELVWNGTAWTDKELSGGARAESAPSAVGNATRRWVYYDGADGKVRWRSNAGVVGVGSASAGPQSNPSASLSSYTESGSTVTIHTGSYIDPQAFTHTRIDKFAVSEGGGISEPAVTEGEPQAISLPAIATLEPHPGQAVSASTGTWEGAPAVLSYQWQRCEPGSSPCTDILGATATTYTPVQADVGHPLVFSVTAQNNEGGAATLIRSSVVTTAAVQNLGSFGIGGWENGKFRKPVDAAVNASGNIWIVDLEKQYLQLFSPTGTYQGRLGEPGNPEKGLLPGQFYYPDCIAIDAAGNIWVGDESGRIQKFNSSGQVLLTFGKSGPNPGEFGTRGVKDLAIDSNGNVWASDYSGHIQQFSPTGQYLKTVGSEGFEPGQLIDSAGMDIGPDGRIWVIDHYTDRINVFSSTGAFLYRWGTSGTNPGQISGPDGLEVDPQGNVWVEEEGTSRIQEFNPFGELMAKFGSFGTGSGQFDIAWPMSLTSDNNGNLWIPDVFNARVQHWKYTP
jgi:sugar lactone lactonase YvrE